MTFELNGSKPIYKQLMDEILKKIRSGELSPGEKLPTERELAQQLYVSRGTIKKAYKELADNNIIEIIQGSGTYVYAEKKLYDGGMRKQATNMINSLLDRLEFWDFPMEEIETLFHMCVIHRTRTNRPVRCAMIDCNSESLGIFKRQLSYLPDITLSAILVDSVIMDDAPDALLADYDLIFTTETHYGQVTECLKTSHENLFPVSEALSQQCIISISTLPQNASIGIVTSSNKFVRKWSGFVRFPVRSPYTLMWMLTPFCNLCKNMTRLLSHPTQPFWSRAFPTVGCKAFMTGEDV